MLEDLATFVELYRSLPTYFSWLVLELIGLLFEYFVFLMRCASRLRLLSFPLLGPLQVLLIKPR